MRSSFSAAVLIAFSTLIPAAAVAQSVAAQAPQSASTNEVAPAPAPAASASGVDAPVGPRIESSSVAFQPAALPESDIQRGASSQNLGQARAMMIVGGAAVVVGLVIGDDVGTLIAVSGAVVGLYGLYQYLK